MRETIADFRALDTEPFGINQADAASHLQFKQHLNLPFELLVDDGLVVSRSYEALRPAGDRIARTVIVVGKDGRVLFRRPGAPPPGEILQAISAAPAG